TFLNNLYGRGGRDYFDIMSAHTYPKHTSSGAPDSPCYDANNLTNSVMGLFQVYTLPKMQAAGDGARKVWLTEVGSPTGSTGLATQQQQANTITDCLQVTKSGVMPNIERIYIYQLQDTEGGVDEGFGLLNNNGGVFTEKPSYSAFKNV